MRDPRNAIERFCIKHPNFGIPGLMKYIAIGNAVVWLLYMIFGAGPVIGTLAFSPSAVLHGQVWRLLSFAFIPFNTSWLGLISVYFFYWIGTVLEKNWGTPQFNVYFFMGMLLTVLTGFIVFAVTGISYAITSSYYIYLSMFLSFAVLFPDVQVLLFFVIPIKMKWLALVDIVFFITGIVREGFPNSLIPIVALLNFLIFCGGDILSLIPGISRRPKVINYKEAARRVNRQQNRAPYTRKCSVCGKTDTEYPDMEFRYCSLCQGYHCFCSEHINNHIHFTE